MVLLSGLSSLARDERVILVGIGLATFGIVSTMMAALTIIRDDTTLPPSQPKARYITQETEDSLEVETLERLVDHPSYSIRDVSIKILCDRAINDPEVIQTLLYGVTRPDYDERMRSLRALALLTSFDELSILHRPQTYSALVRSLELSLDDVPRPKLDDPHWDEYYLRDVAERFCLMFLLDLLNKNDAGLLVKAKFVEKWLAKQDWGDSPAERRKLFSEYMDHKNNRIVHIVGRIRHTKGGLKALQKEGLMDASRARRQRQELPDVIMELEPVILRESVEVLESLVPRTREQSVEEQRLRRQHREAMVLNDGTRPFGREDIIERDHDTID
ncbi:Conserved hypothetical, protein [Geosmithia morbida]|uniref:Conserved hypothetical, protein n=1 Tax=Geosmithia morbida TaxID=1094350 RepID=A0A9P4YXJ1_9HYPO|nr:Conserved hypothetical, protein [Geosmithia morbida]KAF4123566.1 Conserved hypothetical, protein [Geosmithia morbida]